ncbi:MAG TPA: hypothetical protein PLA02_02475 [Brevefilum fermentans]|nr:hypothetical protein [Brevefilum fermentans]HQA28066.1 hypothetical protein [Brevefilum fermentans]
MKVLKIVFGLLIILALISAPAVIAQEGDFPWREAPPEGTVYEPSPDFDPYHRVDDNPPIDGDIEQLIAEKQQALLESGIMTELPEMETFTPPPLSPEDMGGIDDVKADPALQESLWPAIEEQKEDAPPSADSPEDARAVKMVGAPIPIATTIDIDEWWPAVAHGGDHYLVVYVRQGNIYGKVYSNTGELKNTITIADWAADCEFPSVAYEAKSGLFVVVYEYHFSSSDYDVVIQLVSPTTGNIGDAYWVSNSVYHEWYPDVACKHTNGTCLVAFQHNQEGRIKGRFYTISSSGITHGSTVRDLSDATGASFPHLAWGVGRGLYMVTYDWWSGVKYSASYTKVYDHPVDGGNQYVHFDSYVAATFPNGTFNSDVTYDPCTEKFLVSFYHLFSATDRDPWVVAKLSTTSAAGFPPFTIAYTTQNEYEGGISFVTDSHLKPFCGSMDNLVVTYINDSVGVKAAELRGNSSTTNPIYVRDATSLQLIVDKNYADYKNQRTAISSGSQKGELFTASSGKWGPPSPWTDLDVEGQIVAISGRVYIPLLRR